MLVLTEKAADDRPHQGLERRQPRDRPVKHIGDLGFLGPDRGHGGEVAEHVPAGPDMIGANAGEPKGDLGLRRAAKQPVSLGVGRGRMAAHGEAKLRRYVALGFLVRRLGRTPPPGAVNLGHVGRIDEADDGVVDAALEAQCHGEIAVTLAEAGNGGDIVGRFDGAAGAPARRHEHPDVPLLLATGIPRHLDFPEIEVLPGDQRRDADALAGGIEAPAVITTLDLLAVEGAVTERNAPVGADIAKREGIAGGIAAEHHGLAEQRHRHQTPGF